MLPAFSRAGARNIVSLLRIRQNVTTRGGASLLSTNYSVRRISRQGNSAVISAKLAAGATPLHDVPPPFTVASTLALVAALAALSSSAVCDDDASIINNDDGGGGPGDKALLSLAEARDFLVSGLREPRRRFGRVVPAVRLEHDKEKDDGGKDFQLSFSLPDGSDWLSVIAAFVETARWSPSKKDQKKLVVGRGGSSFEVHSAKEACKGHVGGGDDGGGEGGPASLCLLLPGGSGSLLLQGPPPPPPPQAGGGEAKGEQPFRYHAKLAGPPGGGGVLRLFKDQGFTKVDLQRAVAAYAAALDSSAAASRGSSSSSSSSRGGGGGGGGGGHDLFGGLGNGFFDGQGGSDFADHFARRALQDAVPPPPPLSPPRGGGFGGSEGVGEVRGGGSGGGSDDDGRAADTNSKKLFEKREALEKLGKLGLAVYEPEDGDGVDWESLAGYAEVQEEVEGTVVLALQDPTKFDAMARKTRKRFESNRPRAVLFEGPPGTGKTLTARIVAKRCGRPLVHVPSEKVLSKWYGESPKNLASVFDACDALGAVLFLDEVDALCSTRESGTMHEATRRLLSVVLQRVEGLEGSLASGTTLVCATNRRQDLDAALLSRFDLTLHFPLPGLAARKAIVGRYAQQLSLEEQAAFAGATKEEMCLSARDLKEVCEHAERRWVAKLIRSEVPSTEDTPPLKEYLSCLQHRVSLGNRGHQNRPGANGDSEQV